LTELECEKFVVEITPSGFRKLSELVVVELASWDDRPPETEPSLQEQKTQIDLPQQREDGTQIYDEDTEQTDS